MAVKAGVPIKICGVTITPKWDWTPTYRKSYGKTLRGEHQDADVLDDYSVKEETKDRLNDIADKYYKWLDENRAAQHRAKWGKR